MKARSDRTRGRGHVRRLAVGLVCYLACFGVLFPPAVMPQVWGQAPAPAASPAPEAGPAVDLAELARQQRADVRRAQRALEALPRTSFDPAAVVAEAGRDADALAAWVGEQIIWVPYRGQLRGTAGVLMDGTGNSLDQALLLQTLLEAAGHEARLVGATLEPAEAEAALARMQQDEAWGEAPGQPAAPMPGDAAAEAIAFERQARQEETLERVVAQTAMLLHAMELDAIPPAAHGPDAAACLQAHHWVQVREDGAWRDLDPLLPALERDGRDAQVLDAEQLPEALRHRIRVRVVVEQWQEGELAEQVALEQVLLPDELVGRFVGFTNVPVGWEPADYEADPPVDELRADLAEITQFVPVLTIDDETVVDRAVQVDGDLTDPPENDALGLEQATRGGLDALRGLGEPEAPKGQWTGQWLEFEVMVPGEPATTVRREVFDLLGPAARHAAGAGTVETLEIDEAMRVSQASELIGVTDLVFPVGDLSHAFAAQLVLQQQIVNQQALLGVAYGVHRDDPEMYRKGAEQLKRLSGPLLSLTLLRRDLSRDRDRLYLAEPNILALHTRVWMEEPTPMHEVTIDIVHNAVAVRPHVEIPPFALRLEQGVLDTSVEAMLLSDEPAVGNAAWQSDYFRNHGVLWSAHREADAAAPEGFPADEAARVRATLEAGQVVVAPPEALEVDGEAVATYWQIDPATGQTLGMGPRGRGATNEYGPLLRIQVRLYLWSASWGPAAVTGASLACLLMIASAVMLKVGVISTGTGADGIISSNAMIQQMAQTCASLLSRQGSPPRQLPGPQSGGTTYMNQAQVTQTMNRAFQVLSQSRGGS